MQKQQNITYLNQKQAQDTDVELMQELGFSIDVLMELAGLSISHSVYDANKQFHEDKLNKFLLLVGVGNNGGDAIVTARHLKMLGKNCEILLFREPTKDLFINLLKTCQANSIPINYFNEQFNKQNNQQEILKYFNTFDMIIDGMFGFSFKPPVRSPYDQVLDCLKTYKQDLPPIFSIDIPSGWDVEKGNIDNQFFTPDYLISLTLPKLVAQNYTGKHYLGGRFIPEQMAKKYNWQIPEYSTDKQFVLLN